MTYLLPTGSPTASSSSSPFASKSAAEFGGTKLTSSASPRRSSPLTAPPLFSPSRDPSPSATASTSTSTAKARPIPVASSNQNDPRTTRRLSAPYPRSPLGLTPSIRSSSGSLLPPNPSSTPMTSPDFAPISTPSPPLSRSQPLLGSYPLSLLHSRMSLAHAPHSLPSTSTHAFSLHLGSMGRGKTCEPSLRCTPSIELPFDATYYDLEDEGAEPSAGRRRSAGGASQTPWVGQVDLEGWYFSRYAAYGHLSSGKRGGTATEPPISPGYQVAPLGQLQLIIKTPSQPVKAFVVPYDLRRLEPGGRLLVRERTYVVASDDADPAVTPNPSKRKEALRYAVQLQFTCSARSSHSVPDVQHGRDSAQTTRHTSSHTPGVPVALDKTNARSYSVSRSIKVVFVSAPPGSAEQLRVERQDELVPPAALLSTLSPSTAETRDPPTTFSFSPGSSLRRAEEWDILRRKWFARRQLEDAASTSPGLTSQIVSDPTGVEHIATTPISPVMPRSLLSPTPRAHVRALSPTSPSPLVMGLPPVSLDPVPARPSTPTQNGFHIPPKPSTRPEKEEDGSRERAASPRPAAMGSGLKIRPHSASRFPRPVVGQVNGSAIGKTRRGSASREERELSERLRRLGREGSHEEAVAEGDESDNRL